MEYTEMTLQELKNAAKELGIKGVTSMKKGELIELLTAVKGHQEANKETVKKESVKKADESATDKQNVQKSEVREKTEVEAKKTSEETRTRDASKADVIDYSLDSGKEEKGILEVRPVGFGFIGCGNFLRGGIDI